MLTPDERTRLSTWLRAQAEIATFFLDSIDELKITQKSFGQSLKRLARTVAGHLGRVRVVITTRPIPIDQQLIEGHLPLPLASNAEATPEAFADVAVRRVRFADTAQGIAVVRPSMRPVAAWLALWRDGIYEEVVRREPEILLIHGDPESLTPVRRSEVLARYVQRYGQGGWRGLSVPAVQVYRFASSDLNPAVQSLWRSGIENPEVRGLILDLIDAGRLQQCAGIAYNVLTDMSAPQSERLSALDALISLQDDRLPKISSMLETKAAMCPASLSRSAVLRLFPKYMDARLLCVVLSRSQEPERIVGDLSWRLPQVIDEADLSPETTNDLRVRLTALVVEEAGWKENRWPREQTKRPDLVPSLMAACNRQFREGVRTDAHWLSQ